MPKVVGKWMMALLTAAILLLSPVALGQVGAADGDSDGSGGGQNNPLMIESSTPADGSIAASDFQYIKIVFNKNIAYMTIRDNNMRCVSLWSGGQRIPAEIIIADDQVEREKRNDVLVKPKQPLQSGATYRVEIAPEMQSKSGVTLGNKAAITFTMVDGSIVSGPVAPVVDQPAKQDTPGSNSLEPLKTTSNDTTAPSGVGFENDTDAPANVILDQDKSSPEASSSNTRFWIALGAAVLVLGIVAYRRLDRSK